MGVESTESVRAILREMYAHGAMARAELARETGLTESAVSRNTRRLVDNAVLMEGQRKRTPNQIGRRHTELTFGEGALVAGIGIRAFQQWVQISDLGGRVLCEALFTAPQVEAAESVLEQCARQLEDLAARNGIAREKIIGIGVAIVGVIDVEQGEVLRADNLSWGRVKVARIIEGLLGIPTMVDSYLNALNLLMNGLPRKDRQRRSVLLALVAVGIGSSLILDDTLIRGRSYSAGQIGHVKVQGEDTLCACGRRGCLDTVASGKALLSRLHDPEAARIPPERAYPEAPRAFAALSMRSEAEPEVAQALHDAGQQLGVALAVIAAATDPERIVCSGFVSADDHYFNGIQAGLDAHRDPRGPKLPILTRNTERGNRAPSALALQHFIFSSARNVEDRLATVLAA
ncbi:MAG: ROK family protein [Roseovarius sp.]